MKTLLKRLGNDWRRGWLVFAVVLLSVAAFFSWGWLAALGVAPVLLALAPCAAMCALGLCMNKMAGNSGTSASKTVERAAQGE